MDWAKWDMGFVKRVTFFCYYEVTNITIPIVIEKMITMHDEYYFLLKDK